MMRKGGLDQRCGRRGLVEEVKNHDLFYSAVRPRRDTRAINSERRIDSLPSLFPRCSPLGRPTKARPVPDSPSSWWIGTRRIHPIAHTTFSFFRIYTSTPAFLVMEYGYFYVRDKMCFQRKHSLCIQTRVSVFDWSVCSLSSASRRLVQFSKRTTIAAVEKTRRG